MLIQSMTKYVSQSEFVKRGYLWLFYRVAFPWYLLLRRNSNLGDSAVQKLVRIHKIHSDIYIYDLLICLDYMYSTETLVV